MLEQQPLLALPLHPLRHPGLLLVEHPALDPERGQVRPAGELAGDGVLVNAVVPSIIDTSANRRAMPDADFDAWPKPAEIAEAIAFLASPTNALTSGAMVPVYGRS